MNAGTALRRPLITGLAVALVALAVDQVSKHWMLVWLMPHSQPVEVTPFFNLVLVWNYGMSFGILAEHRGIAPFLLGGVAAVIMLVLLSWLRRAANHWVALALGLVLGGAAGNLLDRVRFGAVTDFLDFHAFGYHWPAFNVADSAIFVGVVMLCWDNLKESGLRKSGPPKNGTVGDDGKS